MSEEKGVKELKAELKRAEMNARKEANDGVTISKDFAVGVPQKPKEKRQPPNEVPNVGVNPRKKKMSENIPFY